ncbi:MAG: alanine racemase [Patescibacteria group bacterium]
MLDSAVKTWLEISASALQSNVRGIKATLKPDVRFMAVVKSNAYGHGTDAVVEALASEVSWFGVDSLIEAESLMRTGEITTDHSVLILGHTPFAAHDRVVRGGFRQVVYDRPAVESLSAAAQQVGGTAKLHLKVETGTSRQGILVDDIPAFIDWLKNVPAVQLEGVYTHYANIEDTSDATYAMSQLKRFADIVELIDNAGLQPELKHTACSAAVMLHPETQFDLVRVGISLYGLWSSDLTRENVKLQGNLIKLKPVLTWKTRLAQVKSLPAKTPISYGLTEKVTRPSRVAVVPVGYYDGYDRKLSSVASVLVRGQRAKVLGRICMNMFVVDVTDVDGAVAGDEVVLLGSQGDETITAEELAAKIGTINYEVVTRINPLLPRILVD